MSGQNNKRAQGLAIFFLILPLFLFLISLSIGSYGISPRGLLKTAFSVVSPASFPDVPAAHRDILLRIPLPRVLLALAVGAALSVSGASLQALFKNPLVNEYILGISSGAAFGAALSLVFLGRAFPPQVGGFVFAVVAVGVLLLF